MLPDSVGCTERSCRGLGAIMGLNIKGFVEHVSRSTRFTWSERKQGVSIQKAQSCPGSDPRPPSHVRVRPGLAPQVFSGGCHSSKCLAGFLFLPKYHLMG